MAHTSISPHSRSSSPHVATASTQHGCGRLNLAHVVDDFEPVLRHAPSSSPLPAPNAVGFPKRVEVITHRRWSAVPPRKFGPCGRRRALASIAWGNLLMHTASRRHRLPYQPQGHLRTDDCAGALRNLAWRLGATDRGPRSSLLFIRLAGSVASRRARRS
jgi:hypothetical protein